MDFDDFEIEINQSQDNFIPITDNGIEIELNLK